MNSRAMQRGTKFPDFKTWAKTFTDNPVAGGKTKGTYNTLGTIKIPNKTPNLHLIGFLVLLVQEATTAGESGCPVIRIDSSDVGLINEDFVISNLGFTDSIATNSKSLCVATQFLPVEVNYPVNNKSFEIKVSSSATFTADWTGFVSAIFCNRPLNALPQDYVLEIINDFEAQSRSLGRYAADAAKAIATANTDVSLSQATVPAKAKQLTGLLSLVIPNAPTADQEIASLITYNAGDISDFAPQEYPCACGYTPSLGTPVGSAQVLKGRYFPVRFKLPGTEFKMSAKVRNVLALTNAPDVVHAMLFKTGERR